eukprot:SAG31_NODE_2406_length_5762_cov_6.711107_2_plen_68_part_00
MKEPAATLQLEDSTDSKLSAKLKLLDDALAAGALSAAQHKDARARLLRKVRAVTFSLLCKYSRNTGL